MGLPIWKDPDEESRKQETVKTDPTAAARSPIRRRPSVHGRRNTRTRLPRDPTLIPSRFGSPPPSIGYNGLRSPRHSNNRSVPPVSTLLESANRRTAAPSPPPRIEAPNDYGLPVVPSISDRERHPNEIIDELTEGRPRDSSQQRQRESQTNLQHVLEEHLRGSPRTRYLSQDAEQDGHLSAPRTRFITRENTPFHRSPEPMSAADRPDSRNGGRAGRSNLPTPPLEQSEDPDSLFVPEQADSRRARAIHSTHPLSNSWRPDSPINGLGDRNRSPTPADGWEIMQTTITPDVALPSADSSFTSAAASQSFTSNDTALTEPEPEPGLRRRSTYNDESDSESDANSILDEIDGMTRDSEERIATAQYAHAMYFHEIRSQEGLSRILHHRTAHAAEGNRFALANESEEIELGFRLINEALNSEQGRRRVFEISQHRPGEARSFEDWLFSSRRDRHRRRRERSSDEEQPCPPPDRRTTSEDAAREANAQVYSYFRRFTADSLADSHRASTDSRRASPPPQYEPPASHPDIETLISRDPPEPHPVSPPSTRSQNEVGDLLLSGDEQDLNAVRRVVERLAQRDDVPDEWWMSMGLNLSRARVRSQTPGSATPRSTVNRNDVHPTANRSGNSHSPDGARVRTGRIERGSGSRL